MENAREHSTIRRMCILLLALCSFLCLMIVPVQASEHTDGEVGLKKPKAIYVKDFDTSLIYNRKASACYNSKWDKYSSYYYYNQMNTYEKRFYDALNAMCLSYLEGTADFTRTISGYPATEYISSTGISMEDAINIAYIFEYSNPQYYFLTTTVGYHQLDDTNYIAFCIYDAFKYGDTRKNITNQLSNKIEQWLSQIDQNASVVEKEKQIHDLLVNSVSYVAGTYDQSIYSTFFLKKTVCAGYARTFELLCNAEGIDCVLVTSDDHAWNKVRLNGCWYEVDCTWDDPVSDVDILWFLHLNRSKDMLLQLDPEGHHIEESMWSFYGPECKLDTGASKYTFGTVKQPTNVTQTPYINVTNDGDTARISIGSSTTGANIYYTVDGTIPSEAGSKSLRYTGTFTVSKEKTVKAIAVYNTFADSTVKSWSAVERPAAEDPVVEYPVVEYPDAAVAPVVVTQPISNTYRYGSKTTALKVAVSPVNMKAISYQWYVKTSATGAGKAISGAVQPTYTPSSTTLGTRYYYCKVTNYDKTAISKQYASIYTRTAKIVINPLPFTSCKITGIKSKTYTGKYLTQSPTVTYQNRRLVLNKDYTISYSNNKNVGIASCIMKGKGIYSGQKKYSFVINAPKTSITYKKTGSKKVSIKWKKMTGISGYQINYSYKSNFKFSTYKTVTGASKYSYTIKNLMKNKYCYIRVRTYKSVAGKKYYSAWSSTIKIKVK